MHEAYEFFPLLKLTVQIDSLTAFDDRLLIGTKQGHLMMYSVNFRSGDTKPDVQLLKYNKSFSKKPIQQLAAIPEHEIVIKLSDNLISIHDLSDGQFTFLKSIGKTKGASAFTIHVKKNISLTGESHSTFRVCVAVKRKLQFYYVKNQDLLDYIPDINLNDIPRALSWCDESICIGFKGSYSIVYIHKEKDRKEDSVELFPPGKHLEPTVTCMSDSMIALGKDTQTKFTNPRGDIDINSTIKWSDLPLAIDYDEPYFVCALKDGVEVRPWSDEPSEATELQLLPIPGACIVQTARPGLVYIASSENIWFVSQVPVSRQIKVLLQEKRFELALRLANISDDSDEDKQKNVYHIQTLYAFDLFHNKKFHKSMEEFLKLDTDPYEVIRLFPALLPQESADTGITDDNLKLEDKDLEKGLLALITYLTESRRRLLKTTDVQSRRVQELMKIIDTTLVKCYLQTNDALVAPVLRRNFCHLEETEQTLRRYHKYSELIILYHTKGLHRKALELLKTQADFADSALRGHERTVQYLQNLGAEHIDLICEFAGWVLATHPKDGLKIFTDDVPEVESLPRPKVLDYFLKTQDHQLVIQYLEHVIHVWKDKNASLHNSLVHEYKERIMELGGEEKALHVKTKLVNFLDKTSCYQPDNVLIHFPGDGFFEERAIINGKLKRHEYALAIYVYLLDNYKQALDYCEKVYSEMECDVYLELVKLLISPPDTLPGVTVPLPPRQPDLERALDLLEGHPTKVEPSRALANLPDSVPLARLQHYLTAALHRSTYQRTQAQLARGLLVTQKLQLEEKKMELERKIFLMTDYSVCIVCGKRFGNLSTFIRRPNGKLCHYSCQEKVAALNAL